MRPYLYSFCFIARSFCFITSAVIQANIIILSKVPQSRNVSVGTLMEFTCATEESGVTSLVISTEPSVPHHESISTDLPSGGKQHQLSIIAPSEHSNIIIIIRCTAVRIPDVNQTNAILMIQGKIMDCR